MTLRDLIDESVLHLPGEPPSEDQPGAPDRPRLRLVQAEPEAGALW